MTSSVLQVEGRRFRIVPEDEYKAMRAALLWRQRQADQDAADVAQAQRRIKDPKRKTISLGQLRAELGL